MPLFLPPPSLLIFRPGVDANEKSEYNPVWPDRLSKGL